jgi:hypothetical protein
MDACIRLSPLRFSAAAKEGQVISGVHVIVYSKNAEADRAFLRDVVGLKSVDVGHGWLIFALPPAEVAFHPSEEHGVHELYLMCDDIEKRNGFSREEGRSVL